MMADQVTPPSGMLHSDTLVPGLTPKVGDVTSNFQALYTSLEDYATTINALVSESSTNTENIDAEETARAAADTALQADVDALDVRIQVLEDTSTGSVSYGSGDVALDDDDMEYAYVLKDEGGTVELLAPSSYSGISAGHVVRVINVSSDTNLIVKFPVASEKSILMSIAPHQMAELRNFSSGWRATTPPSNPATITFTANYDAGNDRYFYQPMHFIRTSDTAGIDLTLPERSNFMPGHKIIVTNAGSSTLDIVAAAGDAIVDPDGSVTEIDALGHETVVLIASETGTWHWLYHDQV